MKHEQIRTWFNLKVKGKNCTVRPYNAETTRKHENNVSWSAGFTHYEIKETGETGCVGINWFEDHAQPLPKSPQKPARARAKPRKDPGEGRIVLMKPIEFKK